MTISIVGEETCPPRASSRAVGDVCGLTTTRFPHYGNLKDSRTMGSIQSIQSTIASFQIMLTPFGQPWLPWPLSRTLIILFLGTKFHQYRKTFEKRSNYCRAAPKKEEFLKQLKFGTQLSSQVFCRELELISCVWKGFERICFFSWIWFFSWEARAVEVTFYLSTFACLGAIACACQRQEISPDHFQSVSQYLYALNPGKVAEESVVKIFQV